MSANTLLITLAGFYLLFLPLRIAWYRKLLSDAKSRVRGKKAAMNIRDRVIELVRVPAGEIVANDKNWRLHGKEQKKAMKGILETVGIADALLAYRSERNGGALTLIDGHLRQSAHDAVWPVLVTDLTDAEADLLLASHDPIAGMAETDGDALKSLLASLDANQNDGMKSLLDHLDQLADSALEAESEQADEYEEDDRDIPEMEMRPSEHHDYIAVFFHTTEDWLKAVDLLGIDRRGFTLKDGKNRKVGMCRVLDGTQLLRTLSGVPKPPMGIPDTSPPMHERDPFG